MSGVPPVSPLLRFSDSLGRPLIGGTLTIYQGGTTTLANTWQDEGLTVLNTNPITLNASGECLVWLDPNETYKFLLKNAAGATQPGYPVDGIAGLLPDEATLVTRTGVEDIENKSSVSIASPKVTGYSFYDGSSDRKFVRGEMNFGTKFGYGNGGGAGVGGSVAQLTSKTTAVTLNKATGVIVGHNESLAAGATARFTLFSTFIDANDCVFAYRRSGGSAEAYEVWVDAVSSGSCQICLRNRTGGAIAQSIDISFMVFESTNS